MFIDRSNENYFSISIGFRLLIDSLSLFFPGGLVVGYVILGGLIFDAIESRYELERLEVKERNRQYFVDQLYIHARQEFNRVLNQTFELKYALWRGGLSRHDERNDGWQIDVEKKLWKNHVDNELLKYFRKEEKNQYGSEQSQQEQNTVQVWTFTSAMLYSATVITTIGYGNITPKTTEGKIATMVKSDRKMTEDEFFFKNFLVYVDICYVWDSSDVHVFNLYR